MGEKWVCLKIVNAAKRYIIIYFTKRTVRAVGKTVKPWIICDHVIPGNLGHFQTTPSSDVTFCVVSWCLDPKAKGRRLSDDLDIQRDSLGVPYEEIKCTGWPRNRWGRTRNIWAGMGRGLKFIERRRNDVCSLCSFLPGPAVTCDFARSSALDSCPCGWASFWASLELVWWFGPSSIWRLVPRNCETVKLVPRRTWYWHSRVRCENRVSPIPMVYCIIDYPIQMAYWNGYVRVYPILRHNQPTPFTAVDISWHPQFWFVAWFRTRNPCAVTMHRLQCTLSATMALSLHTQLGLKSRRGSHQGKTKIQGLQ